MPDPHDSLAIFAEIAVALCGFSGIVIAFGSRSVEHFSATALRRLANLFMLSGFVLSVSLVGISLLHLTELTPELFWSSASIITFVLGSLWLVRDILKVIALRRADRDSIVLPLVVIFDCLAFITILLQLYNFLALQTAWPFFLALSLTTAGAFQQFILLVQMRIKTTD